MGRSNHIPPGSAAPRSVDTESHYPFAERAWFWIAQAVIYVFAGLAVIWFLHVTAPVLP